MVRDAAPADATELAALHALAFDHPWTAREITPFM